MLKNIKAVIFDLDGVITDTSALHERAWRKMAGQEGISFGEDTANRLRGVSRRRSLEIILESANKTYPQRQFEQLMERKNSYYRESLNELTHESLLPGVKELLEKLKQNGYRLAIASSSKNAALVIENLEIGEGFEAVVDGNEINRSKPDPEIFQKAAQKLCLAPDECIVVEDAASGVDAANAGGFVSVGIGPESRFVGGDSRPVLRFDNIREFGVYMIDIFLKKINIT